MYNDFRKSIQRVGKKCANSMPNCGQQENTMIVREGSLEKSENEFRSEFPMIVPKVCKYHPKKVHTKFSLQKIMHRVRKSCAMRVKRG